MHPIDLVLSRMPVLMNDFLRHQHKKIRLKIFLCGRKPEDRHFDLRKQVERLLKIRMGCDPFLGEDIEDLKDGPKPDRNHSTLLRSLSHWGA